MRRKTSHGEESDEDEEAIKQSHMITEYDGSGDLLARSPVHAEDKDGVVLVMQLKP